MLIADRPSWDSDYDLGVGRPSVLKFFLSFLSNPTTIFETTWAPRYNSFHPKFDTPQAPYSPALTIVICVSIPLFSMFAIFTSGKGKRHHTRFYPVEEANADQNGNPRAGTVVDRGVTTDSRLPLWFLPARWISKFDLSRCFCLISASQHTADFKELRSPRITSSFMTRSDSRPMNSRTLRTWSATCLLEQRKLWVWFHRGPGVGGSGTNGTGAAIVRKGGLGGKHDMVSAVNTPLFIPSFHFASLMYLQ